MAEMDIGQSIFEYGQTYVALSRIKSLDGLYLSAFHAHKIRANPLVTEFYDTIPPRNAEFYDIFFTQEQSKPGKLLTTELTTTENIFSQFANEQSPTSPILPSSSATSSSKILVNVNKDYLSKQWNETTKFCVKKI
jgi:hypothetical protein